MNRQLFVETFGQDFIDAASMNREDSIRVLLDEKHYPVYSKNKYFHNLKNYAHRSSDAGFENFLDLYPVNVAILEYVIKHLNEFKGKTWLDYGCGLGQLGVYLNYLGVEFYGHDIFDQGVPKEITLDFLKKYKLEDRLIDNLNDVYSRDWHTVSHSGIWCKLDFGKFNNIQYVFEDSHYKCENRNSFDIFNRVDTNKLIIIHKRK